MVAEFSSLFVAPVGIHINHLIAEGLGKGVLPWAEKPSTFRKRCVSCLSQLVLLPERR